MEKLSDFITEVLNSVPDETSITFDLGVVPSKSKGIIVVDSPAVGVSRIKFSFYKRKKEEWE